MSVRTLALVAIPLVIAGALLAAYLLFFTKEAPQDTEPVSDPFAPSQSGTVDGPGDTYAVTLTDGSQVEVPDFRENQPDWAGAQSGYQVAGSEEETYHILYFEDGSGFLISLFNEPLRESRFAAEGELRSTLRLPNETLCKLSVEVAVSRSVNEVYAGRNLGLSFCPGSVELP